jgi:RecA/RadA recombinase
MASIINLVEFSWDSLEIEALFKSSATISTCSQPEITRIEDLLNLHGIVELFGEAGAGKTLICQYLAAQFLLHSPRRALYISLDDYYKPNNFISFMSRKHQLGYVNEPSSRLLVHHEFEAEALSIFICTKLRASILKYDIGLIVIDSIAAPFRSSDIDIRKGQLATIAATLRDLAHQYSVNILCTNQVAAMFDSNHSNASDSFGESINPCPGNGWCTLIDHRVFIERTSNPHIRKAKIVGSTAMKGDSTVEVNILNFV